MKNLYHMLGIDPNASSEEVAAALESKPDTERFALILQDGEKRAAYDQVHATLKAIGILRQRLGLDSGDSWFLQDSPDFAPRLLQEKKTRAARPASPQVTTPGTNQAGAPQPQRSEPSTGSKQSLLITAGVVVVMLAILAYLFL